MEKAYATIEMGQSMLGNGSMTITMAKEFSILKLTNSNMENGNLEICRDLASMKMMQASSMKVTSSMEPNQAGESSTNKTKYTLKESGSLDSDMARVSGIWMMASLRDSGVMESDME